MTEAIRRTLTDTDLSTRIVQSTTVVASPSGASETVIGSVTIPSGLTIGVGVFLSGWAAFTCGSTASAANLKIRQTSVSGTTIVATGATTAGIAGAALLELGAQGIDTAPADGQVYKLTLTVTGAGSASTVSALQLVAIVV